MLCDEAWISSNCSDFAAAITSGEGSRGTSSEVGGTVVLDFETNGNVVLSVAQC